MKRHLIAALRWIGVVPTFIIAALLIKVIWSFVWALAVDPDMVADLNRSPGLSGHYLSGPFYLLVLYAVTSSGSIIAATLMAPSYRRTVRTTFAIVCALALVVMTWVTYSVPSFSASMGGHINFGIEDVVRFCMEGLGYAFGIFMSFSVNMDELWEELATRKS